jgi:hypothetical protein
METLTGGGTVVTMRWARDPTDQNPPDSTVAVPVGVDGLELRMGDRGLGDGIDPFGVDEGHEVGHEVLHSTWRGRDEGSITGRGAADPGLRGAKGTHHLVGQVTGRTHEAPMPLVEVLDLEVAPGPAEGLPHGGEIVGHPAGGGIRGVADLRRRDIDERGAEPFDVRGPHFSPQQHQGQR